MRILRINREERWFATITLAALCVLQGLFIAKFWQCFSYFDDQSWTLFLRNFHMSGYDPITYDVVTRWQIGYNIVRHPLLPFMVYPLYLVNQLLWSLTGANCVQFVVGAVLVFCSFYAALFFLRIMRHVVGLRLRYAVLITAFFFGCANIMLVTVVPDHFVVSLCLILLTLLRAGEKMRAGTKFSVLEASLLFVLTAGVTLSNGVIVMLAVLFVNGKATFQWRLLLAGAALSAAMLATGFVVNDNIAEPKDEQIERWTDTETPRWEIIVENFLGESIQLHRRYLLWDVMVKRPVIVHYSWWAQYVAEAFIMLFFLAGLWCGRKSRFLWLTMACMAYAVVLHIVLGFAIKEVYIMAAHWLYAIPIAIAYLFTLPTATRKRLLALPAALRKWLLALPQVLFSLITLYLIAYNGYLIIYCLTWTLSTK